MRERGSEGGEGEEESERVVRDETVTAREKERGESEGKGREWREREIQR